MLTLMWLTGPCFVHHNRNLLTSMVQKSLGHLVYFSMPIIVVDTTIVINVVY